MSLKRTEPHETWCPVHKSRHHRFSDWSYWGCVHPKCECGYEDKSRIVDGAKPDAEENKHG